MRPTDTDTTWAITTNLFAGTVEKVQTVVLTEFCGVLSLFHSFHFIHSKFSYFWNSYKFPECFLENSLLNKKQTNRPNRQQTCERVDPIYTLTQVSLLHTS